MSIQVTLELNNLNELSNFFECITSNQSSEFYTEVFRYLTDYTFSENESKQDFNDCCWHLIKHINFYRLEKLCFNLYNFIISKNNTVNQKIFKDCLLQEYFEDDDGFKDDLAGTNFIFEQFLKYSVYENDFEMVCKMVQSFCVCEDIFKKAICDFINNKNFEIIKEICNYIENSTFNEIFEIMLRYNSKEINDIAIEMYKDYYEI